MKNKDIFKRENIQYQKHFQEEKKIYTYLTVTNDDHCVDQWIHIVKLVMLICKSKITIKKIS